MLIIPAIDIKAGSVVRLTHGDPKQETVYSSDPVEMAKRWVAQGAQRLHVVDLDGAFTGHPANLDLVYRIKDAVNVVVEFGGGLRDPDTVKKVLDRGIGRAIVGTAILKYPQWIKTTLAEYPGRLMASLDAVNGEVMIEGWQADSGHTLADVIKTIDNLGFREIVYTDIKQDGTLKGPNVKSIGEVLAMTHMGVYASGGISSLDDLKALKALEAKGLKGAILGKSLYAGKINLPDALAIAK
jgi:phosphoribosylformimino-5-aminoimidazole carboxamide ribotide isomerase